MSKTASSWIVIAIVGLITVFNLLNPKAFAMFWLGLSVTFFVFLGVFHFLDRRGKMS